MGPGVPLHVTHMTMIPDSFNLDQLSEALANAPTEPEAKEVPNNKALTDDELWDLACEHVQTSAAACDDRPLVMHKAMVLQIISKMIAFHEAVAEDVAKENPEAATGWLKDAGKLQAIVNILMNVQLDSEGDFLLQE